MTGAIVQSRSTIAVGFHSYGVLTLATLITLPI
jgi:hypothetical protein